MTENTEVVRLPKTFVKATKNSVNAESAHTLISQIINEAPQFSWTVCLFPAGIHFNRTPPSCFISVK